LSKGFLKRLVETLLILLCFYRAEAQQSALPLQSHLHRKLVWNLHRDSVMITTGVRPLHHTPEIDHAVRAVFHDSMKIYYNIQEVAFTNHLLHFSREDFSLAADPLFAFQWGTDFKFESGDGRARTYTNTRGAQIMGRIGKQVSFASWFYENQEFFPRYFTNYIEKRGELYYNGVNYFRTNGVVPGASRTKTFKDFGFDYAYAGGYVLLQPIRQVQLQFGQYSNFIGHGYRSMFLSDNAPVYPALNVRYAITPKLSFSYLYASLTELRRLPARTTPESLFYRKSASFYVLTWRPSPRFELALMEGLQWYTMADTGSRSFNFWQINPIPGIATAVNGFNGLNNSMIGLQSEFWATKNIRTYAQIVLDGLSPFRFGAMAGTAIHQSFGIRQLTAQAEVCYAAPYTHASTLPRQSVSHANIPLAHPLGAGFTEGLVNVRYDHNRYYFGEIATNMQWVRIDTGVVNGGGDPLRVYAGADNRFVKGLVWLLKVEAGVKLNVKTNMHLVAGFLYRRTNSPSERPETQYLYFAWRTNLENRYTDL
jgi:hypothetical protein